MSRESNNQGRAYEYACLTTLEEEIARHRAVGTERNTSYYAALNAWEQIDVDLKNVYQESAKAAVEMVFALEPLVTEDDNDEVQLRLQPDRAGEEGDVRDIVIGRESINWEVGLSLKHNHFAVKHSRLAKNLDFGAKWFGVACSEQYWNEVAPVFEYLSEAKNRGVMWRQLSEKEEDVYIPLLRAFLNEVERSYELDRQIPRRMVEYLLGEYDFYKVISLDVQRVTQVQAFNLHGTLNQASGECQPRITVPGSCLPRRIIGMGFKEGSNNTVEIYMDEGWQFSFRIHNASTYVETSLKFDIQIIGMPTTILTINHEWH